MPEVVFFAVKVGFLALLWLFVVVAVRVIRTDVVAPPVARRPLEPSRAATPAPYPADAPPTGRAAAVPSRQPRQPTHLVVTEGSLAGTTVRLDRGPVTIGRAQDSTLVLTDDYASSHHARLVPSPDGWLLEDLSSTNGTFVARNRVVEPVPVGVGSSIRIGKTVLELRP